MFLILSQVETDVFMPLAQFGAAGLMGGLWWWERRYSRQREEELTRAHEAIMSQREHISTLTSVIENNTRAVTEFTAAQRELLAMVRGRWAK